MERALSHLNKEGLMSNVNIVGLVALTAYTVKTNLELNKKINELGDEIETMKGNFNENNKRANIAFTRLNQRIQDTGNIVKKIKRDDKVVEVTDDVYDDDKDDVSSALEVLMNRK